jgi:hypothetical protein
VTASETGGSSAARGDEIPTAFMGEWDGSGRSNSGAYLGEYRCSFALQYEGAPGHQQRKVGYSRWIVGPPGGNSQQPGEWGVVRAGGCTRADCSWPQNSLRGWRRANASERILARLTYTKKRPVPYLKSRPFLRKILSDTSGRFAVLRATAGE